VLRLGLNAYPVIDGKIDPAFETDAIAASLGGEYFRQDKLTVLAGKLPALDSADEIAVTEPMAEAFGLHPGSHMTWQFYRETIGPDGLPTSAAPVAAQRTTFVVTAITAAPPVLGDRFDDIDGAILPPAATPTYLNGEWGFGWVAMRLRGGAAGLPGIRRQLAVLERKLSEKYHFPVYFDIRVLAIIQHEAQQAIEPEADALAVLGGLIALATLVLAGQGLTQVVSRSAADATLLRAMGATRSETALALAGPGCAAIAGSAVLSVAGAIALSPLAPVGPVRAYDPQTGVRADWLVLGAGTVALLLLLGGVLAWLSWRAAGQAAEPAPPQPLPVITASRRSGVPITALTGMRYALERGYGRQRAPVRATLAGSVAAVAALAVSAVFSSSLSGLVSHPARYGWNWPTLIQSQAGWGTWAPDAMTSIMARQHGITGWSEFGFGQLAIDHQVIPVLGLLQHGANAPAPPTTSGHPLAAADQIELGTVTMRALGLKVGDKVTVGAARRPFTVVGTVTLPSMGTVLTDHVSLGRGAMMEEDAMLAADRLEPYTQAVFTAANANDIEEGSAFYPSAVAIYARSGADARQAAASILRREPDGTPGGMYTLPPEPAAQIVNFQQMGALPLTIALGVAIAAVLALALTIVASVRQRRRELALLKSLGMRRSQLRAVVFSQESTILAVAIVIGIPTGIAAGRWAWTAFANAIGVVPAPVVPTAALALGVLALLAAGNILATWPAAIAARTSVALTLRSE